MKGGGGGSARGEVRGIAVTEEKIETDRTQGKRMGKLSKPPSKTHTDGRLVKQEKQKGKKNDPGWPEMGWEGGREGEAVWCYADCFAGCSLCVQGGRTPGACHLGLFQVVKA